MTETDEFRSALQSLSRFFVGGADMEETLLTVSQLALKAIHGVDHAGMSLHDGEKVTTHAFTDDIAIAIDQVQYAADAGPCLEAYRTQKVVTVNDMAARDHWPGFANVCGEYGIKSTLALPLHANGTDLGALNLFSDSAAAFDDDTIEVATVFATTASVVLSNAKAYWETYELSQQMAQAMQSRAVIEQAKGILMARSGHTDAEAFRALTSASQRSNRKVRDIAAEIVAHVRQAPPNGK